MTDRLDRPITRRELVEACERTAERTESELKLLALAADLRRAPEPTHQPVNLAFCVCGARLIDGVCSRCSEWSKASRPSCATRDGCRIDEAHHDRACPLYWFDRTNEQWRYAENFRIRAETAEARVQELEALSNDATPRKVT